MRHGSLFSGIGGFDLSAEWMVKHKIIMKQKPKEHYRIIHDWINKHYGKADLCSNPDCKGISKFFEYCLKKGCEHERNINNYIKLCRSCHRHYDMPENKSSIALPIAGKYNSMLSLGPKSCERKIILLPSNKIFDSGKKLADHIGANKSDVYKVANGTRISVKGHKVMWADANS